MKLLEHCELSQLAITHAISGRMEVNVVVPVA